MPSVPDSSSGKPISKGTAPGRTVHTKKNRKKSKSTDPDELTFFQPLSSSPEAADQPKPLSAVKASLTELNTRYPPSRSASQDSTPTGELEERPRCSFKSSSKKPYKIEWNKFDEDSIKQEDNEELYNLILRKKNNDNVRDCVIAWKKNGHSDYTAKVFKPGFSLWNADGTPIVRRRQSLHYSGKSMAARAQLPASDPEYIAEELDTTKEGAVLKCMYDVGEYAKENAPLLKRLTGQPSW